MNWSHLLDSIALAGCAAIIGFVVTRIMARLMNVADVDRTSKWGSKIAWIASGSVSYILFSLEIPATTIVPIALALSLTLPALGLFFTAAGAFESLLCKFADYIASMLRRQ